MRVPEKGLKRFPVVMRTGDTPVPIPNTTVKTCTADGTMLETAWESRWLPEPKKEKRDKGCASGIRMQGVQWSGDAAYVFRDGCMNSRKSTLKTAHWKTSNIRYKRDVKKIL